ncbi:MAG: pilus assembly protein PilN [Cycloclasticus sp. symbiont of Poecilosclerida sp. M]|nr:MAG: pilus assembly protein PilN [Cycloclasticus sp. symbiont of Poecilosclerida sp. M]
MSRINLLPWREDLKKQRQREFLSTLGLAAIAMLLSMLLVHATYTSMIENQANRNSVIQKEIKLLDEKIKTINALAKTKNQLIARMQVIQNLQRSRPEIVHMFDQLATTVPEGVYLKSFIQNGQNLVIQGNAESNTRVSAYMDRLEESPWLKGTDLNIISSKALGVNGFTLRVSQAKAAKKEENK